MAESEIMKLITSFLNAYTANTQSRDQKAVKNAINGIKREIKKQGQKNKKTQLIIDCKSITAFAFWNFIVMRTFSGMI